MVLKLILVHWKVLLKLYFSNVFSVIDVPHYSYVVYRAFLQFLYTDRVDLPPEDAIGLYGPRPSSYH